MKKLKLIIREKGRYVTIPGMRPFRSPVNVDVSKVKIAVLIQSLHSCGVSDYELVSVSRTGEVLKSWNKNDISAPDKKQHDEKLLKKLDKLDKLEGMLLSLLSKKESQNDNNSEQITNRLTKIEKMLRSGSTFVNTDFKKSSTPIVEEIEDHFIPSIDVGNMKLSGKTNEIVEKTSKRDIDDAVDLLSSLTRNGGKK